jgi:hypothetical protein
MAQNVTRADLRTAVRNRGEFRSAYISDEEINTYINVSLAHLYDIIISADPSYYLTQADVTISSGTRSYALPSDFYKCVGVALYDATAVDDYHALDTFNFEERWDEISLSANRDTRYEIRGANILFHPTPTFDGKAILEYIPTPIVLDEDVTTWDSVNLWTEWVTMDVLIACAAKEETDPTIWVQQRERLEKRIFGIGKRDLGKPKTSSTSSTLKALRHAVRNRGSWTEADVSDNQLTSFVNTSLAALRDLVAKNDPSHFVTYSDITVSSGTREYSLPATFYKVVGVDAHDAVATEDGYYVLDHFNWEERYDSTPTSSKQYTRYHIRGDKIYFHPTPTWSGTVRLEYIPTFTELSDPTDTFDLFNHWHEWVILDCAVKCCAATGKDPQIFLAQQAKAEERINTFSARDLVQPVTVSTDGTNLRSLQLAVRNRGAWPKEALNDSQLTAWINSSISAFVDLISKHEPAYYLTRSDVSVVSGTKEYDLPSGFYKLHGVAVEDSSQPDGYAVLNRFNWDERYDYTYSADKWDTRYMVRGTKIHFHPTPSWTGTVRLEYIPVPTALAQPTDTFTFYNNWQEWVILDCCIKVCALTGSDPQVYMAELQKVEQRIKGFAERDVGKPKTVADYKRVSKYDPRFWWRR